MKTHSNLAQPSDAENVDLACWESNIIDSAMALNWTAIDDINIKHVVSVTTFKPSHMLFN